MNCCGFVPKGAQNTEVYEYQAANTNDNQTPATANDTPLNAEEIRVPLLRSSDAAAITIEESRKEYKIDDEVSLHKFEKVVGFIPHMYPQYEPSKDEEYEEIENVKILTIGPKDSGKTTFLNYLQNQDTCSREENTELFTVFMHSKHPGLLPGAQFIKNHSDYSQLSKFGTAFLNQLQCVQQSSKYLEHLTVIDTPGVTSLQASEYDSKEVYVALAGQVDLIIVLLDAHSSELSKEMCNLLMALHAFDHKIRIVLNQADCVNREQLRKNYGSIMWALSRIYNNSKEEVQLYTASFCRTNSLQCNKEHKALLREIQTLVTEVAQKRYVKKKHEDHCHLTRRAGAVWAHALIVRHLNLRYTEAAKQTFGYTKKKLKSDVFESLQSYLKIFAREHKIPEECLPKMDKDANYFENWLKEHKEWNLFYCIEDTEIEDLLNMYNAAEVVINNPEDYVEKQLRHLDVSESETSDVASETELTYANQEHVYDTLTEPARKLSIQTSTTGLPKMSGKICSSRIIITALTILLVVMTALSVGCVVYFSLLCAEEEPMPKQEPDHGLEVKWVLHISSPNKTSLGLVAIPRNISESQLAINASQLAKNVSAADELCRAMNFSYMWKPRDKHSINEMKTHFPLSFFTHDEFNAPILNMDSTAKRVTYTGKLLEERYCAQNAGDVDFNAPKPSFVFHTRKTLPKYILCEKPRAGGVANDKI